MPFRLAKPTIGEVFQAVVWFLTVVSLFIYDHARIQAQEEKWREHEARIVSFEKGGSQGLVLHAAIDDQRDAETQRRLLLAEQQLSALMQDAATTKQQFAEILRRLPKRNE